MLKNKILLSVVLFGLPCANALAGTAAHVHASVSGGMGLLLLAGISLGIRKFSAK